VKLIWTTQCVLSNRVDLFQEDWEHIIQGHPEMIGNELLVKQAVERPVFIQQAGNATTAAYVLPADSLHPEGVRVIVGFTSSLWLSGGKFGEVKTGYPIDTRAYPNPSLGQVVWTKASEGER
jgi:hypothetical protein